MNRSLLLLAPTLLFAAEERTLTLREALAAAVAATPVLIADLDAGRSDEDAAAARIRALYPNLSATGTAGKRTNAVTGANGTDATDPATTLDARLRIGQPILNLNSYHTWRAAQAGRSVALANRRLAVETACTNAAEAYVELLRSRTQVVDRTSDLLLAEELLKLAKARVSAGTSPALDATRAEGQVAASRTALVSAQGAAEQATISLARVLDWDPAKTLVPADTLTDVAQTDAPTDDSAQAAAQESRPEKAASAAAQAAAIAARKAANGARLPTVEAFADGGYTGPSTGDMARTWAAGVSVTIPLFDSSPWTAESAALAERQAQLRHLDTNRRIVAEVRGAIVGLTSATAGLAAAKEQDRVAKAELSQAKDRFTAGVASNLEVINAQLSASQATTALTNALANLAQARVRLAQAVGRASTLK
jgi:outer membrane protein TolC